MSFTKISSQTYVCASSDEKTTTGVVTGSVCWEYDTDSRWVFDGTAWREFGDQAQDSRDAIVTFLQALTLDDVVDPAVLVSMMFEHHEVHEGNTYNVNHSTTDAAPLADDANFDLWVSVPEGTFPHMVWDLWCEGLAQGYLYEGPTVSDEGTALTPWNRQRNSANAATVVVKHTPTVSGVGTALHNGEWQGSTGVGVSRNQGGSRATQEIDLKENTTYLFRITARASNVRASISLDWYE